MKARFILYFLLLTVFAVEIRANDVSWDFDPYAYQYDMTVYIALSSVDGEDVDDASDYRIAAFCGDECRGIAENKTSGGHEYVYLRIRSNKAEGETINFKVRNLKDGKVASATETMGFKSQQTTGYPSKPFSINALSDPNFIVIDSSDSETAKVVRTGDQVEFTDGDYKSVSVTEDVDDVDISYTRSFSSTDWQALYVPFALDVSTDLAGFDVYEFSSASEDVVYVSKVESTTTEPNTPYFIRAKESTGSKTFTLTGTTLVATQECKVGTSYFDVMGTYAKLEYSDVDATWYALKDGKFLIAGEGAVLNPFRFYLKKKGTASVKDCINIVFEGSTDISTFGNGKEMEGSSFNIAGQAVDVDYKGIVIINGKKIFKK